MSDPTCLPQIKNKQNNKINTLFQQTNSRITLIWKKRDPHFHEY